MKNYADVNAPTEHPAEREYRFRNAPRMLGQVGQIEAWLKGGEIVLVQTVSHRYAKEVEMTMTASQAARLAQILTPEPMEPDEVPV